MLDRTAAFEWTRKLLVLTCLIFGVLLIARVYGLLTAADPQSELADTRLTIADAPLGPDGTANAAAVETNGHDGEGNGEPSGEKSTATTDSKGDSKATGKGDATGAKKAAKTTAKTSPQKPNTKPTKKKTPKPKLPDPYKVIGKKYIFGIKPPRKLLPITLEGIGGDYAFIRAPTGASGMVAIGKTFAGIKLLALSQNRALIEYKGEKKELTIYNGFGSKPFLPKKSSKTATKPGPTKKPEKKPGAKPPAGDKSGNDKAAGKIPTGMAPAGRPSTTSAPTSNLAVKTASPSNSENPPEPTARPSAARKN